MTPVLRIENVSKAYPGVQALDDVTMELRQNEVLGLIGQNGSGKSTLLKIMAGLERPDQGRILLRGEPTAISSPLAAARLGIGMVHQEQSLIANLTVAENIFFDKPTANRRLGIYHWRGLYREAEKQLAKLQSSIPPDVIVERLSFSDRQTVEFAKVLAVEELIDQPLVILFDEPTSLLSVSEVQDLFRQIERLSTRASIVFVSHRMDEVLEISNRVHVMSLGVNVAERHRGDTDHEELYHLMVGSARSKDYYFEERRKPLYDPREKLKIQNMSCKGHFEDVSFSVRPGEIIGLTGVAGSGAEEVCRAIFGAEDGVSGRIELNGLSFRPSNKPDFAIARGIGYVPAERKAEGVLAGRTILDNIILTFGPELGSRRIVDFDAEAERAMKWIEALKVKTPNVAEYVERLSGGNQQKVSLAKWLITDRLQVLVLDHPTRGLDPGAKADVFEAMRNLAAEGLSIIFVADTLEETMGMADTVIAMRDGRITETFKDLNQRKPAPEDIVKAMV